MKKTPLGLMPRDIWLYKRLEDIEGAIIRYLESSMEIPAEWMHEYNELLKEVDVYE